MNFYPFHIGDYAVHTRHLTLIEDLAYRRLLDLYYTTEQPITLDIEKASKLIGMRDYIKEVSEILSDFFLKSEDGYRNIRADREIEAYKAKADRARSANSSRWNAKKSDSVLKSDLKSDALLIPTNNQEPITNNQEPVKTKAQREKRADVFDAHSKLVELGVGDAVANDFMAIRKKKRAPLTETALAEIQRESVKAGITLHQALEKCCARGWQGFEADWVTTTATNARASPYESEKDRSRREFAESIFGKTKHEPANERDITSVAERLD